MSWIKNGVLHLTCSTTWSEYKASTISRTGLLKAPQERHQPRVPQPGLVGIMGHQEVIHASSKKTKSEMHEA